MINFEQVKQITTEVEQKWVIEVGNEGDFGYTQEMVDEINNCKTISDIANWYGKRGFNNKESYECIIANLMLVGTLNK